MTRHITKTPIYKVGDRVEFVWKGKWEGVTPGTITKIDKKRKLVSVAWDDHKSTTSSFEFLSKNTKLIVDKLNKV